MEWLGENWEVVVISIGGLSAIASALNALTDHYEKLKGVSRWFTFITEMLSFVASRGVVSPTGGRLKFPLTSRKDPSGSPDDEAGEITFDLVGAIAGSAIIFAVIFFALSQLAGCTEGWRKGVQGSAEVATKSAVAALNVAESVCRATAHECADSGDMLCEELTACHSKMLYISDLVERVGQLSQAVVEALDAGRDADVEVLSAQLWRVLQEARSMAMEMTEGRVSI